MRSSFPYIIIGLILLSGGFSHAQNTFKKEQFVVDGQSVNYRILYPENFSPSKQYPVVLFLHGRGESGSDNEKQLVNGSKLFLDQGFREKYPCIVIFPQCPTDDYWSNADVTRTSGKVSFIFKNGGEPTHALSLVMSLMDSIVALNYSKNNQIYVGGLSMGGMGTFEILYRRPDMFAAAFPICGAGNVETASAYAKKVKLWVFHGAKDDIVYPGYSTNLVIAIREAGGSAKYTLYKEANHNSWDSAFAEPDLFPWLFSVTKTLAK